MELGDNEVARLRRHRVDAKERLVERAPLPVGAIVSSRPYQGRLAKDKRVGDVVTAAPDVGALATQGEVHARVGTGATPLVDLNGDRIGPRDEIRRRQSGILPTRLVGDGSAGKVIEPGARS